ncbi:polyprenyl synthetase family protein [Pedobacter sp. HMF7647]|uniref:Polyprenyl synthetase family protein n=1 Tax=Hufsiella arboris TaxID=2695275 RepID=A0A7K1Y8Q1_9SPHI|nr:polyprenyl synthetase family protein [Hufsiella arboris]MXV50449.1 polyprenyl synthetase family protein [Hufsiella arboris]
MQSLHTLQNLINEAIEEKRFNEKPAELYDPINYIMSLGGKRMRPVFLLMACDLFGGSVLSALDAAVGIEMFHNFTLMHDDIMDKAPIRRGKETVHVKWNENVAILSGDIMFVEAYKLMIKVEDNILRDVLKVFGDTAASVCQGQQIDMNYEQTDEVSVDEYLEMIRLKTAVLLAGALEIGSLIGNAGHENAQTMYQFGENLGIAFQLQDDILDVYGDPEKFGKQVGGDILSNKKTFLLIKALEDAGELDNEELSYWINAENPEPQTKIQSVTSIYNRLGIRQLAEQEMNRHAEKALQYLEALPVDADKKQILRRFAEDLLVREN